MPILMLLAFQHAAARDANAQDAAVASGEPREVIAAIPRLFPPLVETYDDGRPVGFAIDVLNAVARRAGLRISYVVENDWRGALRALAEGRAQLVPGVGKTAAYGRDMAFTRPFDTIPVSLFVRSSTRDINGILDLTERKVAVVRGNVGAAVLKPYRSISSVSYTSFEDALVALLSGHTDALVYPAPPIMRTAREIGVLDRIKVVGAPLAETKRSIAVNARDTALLRRLDAALGAFLTTPEFKQIFRRWNEPEPAFFSRREVWWVLSGILLTLLIGFAVWRYISVVRLNRALVETSEARSRAESARLASDRQLDFAFETGSVGMTITDPDGMLLRVNRAFCDFLGYSEEDMLGRPIQDFVHPDDVADSVKGRQARISGEIETVNVERRFVGKSGSMVWGLCGFSAVHDDAGEVVYIMGNIQDITERKKAEEALRYSEERFRSAFQHAGVGVVVVDADGFFVEVNKAVCDLLGYTEHELIGKTTLDITHPDDLETTRKRREKILSGESARYNLEKRYLRKDGGTVWAISSISTLKNPDGSLRNILFYLQDITARKAAEDARREADARFRTAFESGGAGMYVLDGDGVFLDVNDSFAGFLGCSREELRGKKFLDYLHPDDLQSGQRNLRVLASGRRPDILFERKYVHRDGRTITGIVSNSAVLRADGKSRYIIANVQDITARKAAETELVRKTEFLDLVRSTAVAANETSNFEDALKVCLDKVCVLLGWPVGHAYVAARDGAPRMLATAIWHLDDPERFEPFRRVTEVTEFAEGDGLPGRILRSRKPDWTANYKTRKNSPRLEAANEARLKSAFGVPILAGSEIVAIIEFFSEHIAERDDALLEVMMQVGTQLGRVFERARAAEATRDNEDQLRHSQKLEAVGQLTGGLAHDFNNLLTIILGNLQLLVRRLDDEKLKEMVFTAERAGRRGAELTQRLLAFGRRQPLEPKVTDLNRLALGMTDLLRRTLGEAFEIETVTATNLNPTLIDPSQVENAILNLAINARDAMPQGGKLTIRTVNQRIGRQRAARYEDVSPGDYVMLAVTDTGVGMAPDVVERAFDPFYTTKEVGRGSGLGLSMIYGFCRQSGGFVTIDSKPGAGTTVSLYLPTTDAVAEREEERSGDAPDEVGSETVLVVEDDPGVRLFAAAVLGSLNYNVLEAEDGNSALELLEANGRIDVLFTDVILPGGADGRDIADHARKRQPDISVLFTSGFAVDGGSNVLESMNENSLLRKPYTGADLAAKIRTVIEMGNMKIP